MKGMRARVGARGGVTVRAKRTGTGKTLIQSDERVNFVCT